MQTPSFTTRDVMVLTDDQFIDIMGKWRNMENEHKKAPLIQLSQKAKNVIYSIQDYVKDHGIVSFISEHNIRNNDQLEKALEKDDLYAYSVTTTWKPRDYTVSVDMEDEEDAKKFTFRFRLPERGRVINRDIPVVKFITKAAHDAIVSKMRERIDGYVDIISLRDMKTLLEPTLWYGEEYDHALVLEPREHNPLGHVVENMTVFEIQLCHIATSACLSRVMVLQCNRHTFSYMIDKLNKAKRVPQPSVSASSSNRQPSQRRQSSQTAISSLLQQQRQQVIRRYTGSKKNVERKISKPDRAYERQILQARKKWLDSQPKPKSSTSSAPPQVKQESRKRSSSSSSSSSSRSASHQQALSAISSPTITTQPIQQAKNQQAPPQKQKSRSSQNLYKLFPVGEQQHPLIKAWHKFRKA